MEERSLRQLIKAYGTVCEYKGKAQNDEQWREAREKDAQTYWGLIETKIKELEGN